MDPAMKTGQLFMFGIDGTDPGPVKPLIEEYSPGGIILFSYNIVSMEQVRHLTGTLQEYAASAGLSPLLISTDQEGGRVTRLGSDLCRQYPSNWQLGEDYLRTGDTGPVRIQADDTAAVLLKAGINMNLAPVLDVVTVEGNTVIADRSYGPDPGVAIRLGSGYISALQSAGVIGTAKHFPGHGPTDVDSHYGLPTVGLAEDVLRAIHLPPFKAAIDSGVDAIMPAHIIYEAWDEWPATLSRKVLTGLLRDELGFKGVVISDDLNMHAISRHYPFPGSMVEAVNAGVDILLVCYAEGVQPAAWQTVHRAVESGEISAESIDSALKRIANLKAKYLKTGGGTA